MSKLGEKFVCALDNDEYCILTVIETVNDRCEMDIIASTGASNRIVLYGCHLDNDDFYVPYTSIPASDRFLYEMTGEMHHLFREANGEVPNSN